MSDSSTGSISKVISGPINSFQEDNRKSNSSSSVAIKSDKTYGKIAEIHPSKPMVRVFTDDGHKVAGGDFISLNHPADEIASRWGTIRLDMRVEVSFTGPSVSSATSASATIVGVEGEDSISSTSLPNEIKRSVWRIFTPGIGVG